MSARHGFLVLLACGAPLARGAGPSAANAPDIDYMIVVTGGELLAGEYPDGHTHFLARTLRPMGLHCVGSMTVDDRASDIEAALRFATARAPLVILTGGLGPTDNDVTRETLEAFTGVPLRESEEVVAAMERRFNTPRDQIRANLLKQARVPTRGTYLKNENGTAVGLVFEVGEKVVAALPGPPRELEPMVRDELVPYLSHRFGAHPPGCSLTVRFVGLGQSAIDQVLDDHVPLPPGLILGSRFEGSRVDFTFAMPHDTPEERAKLETLKSQIARRFGESIYAFGDETLEGVVLAAMAERGMSLAIVEVGSGGALAAALNGIPRASGVIAGAFSAPDARRMRALLRVPDGGASAAAAGEDAAGVLAEAAARETRASASLVVGEPETGAGGACSLPVVFWRAGRSVETQRLGIRGTDPASRATLVTGLLDLLRRHLVGKRDS